MPKVSVIMPVYNGEKYLRQCLDSLINQSLEDIEIICINDCSKDNSLNILNEYAAKDSRLKIINNDTNKGQSISRNIALDYVKSPYVMFIDQDDWYELSTCEKAYKQIHLNNNDFAIFHVKFQYQNGTSYTYYERLEPFKHVINQPDIKPYELGTNVFVASYIWCEIFKKEFLDKNSIRFFVEKQADDVPFFIKAMVYANSISIINEPLYNYRCYEESTTSSRTDLWDSLFTAREKSYKIICDSAHKDAFIDAFWVYHIKSMMHWFYHFTKINPNINKDFYNRLRDSFIFIADNYPQSIEKIKNDIDYKNFKRIVKESFIKRQVRFLFLKIFSIKNSEDKTHKVITILGIKFSIKKKIHFPLRAKKYNKIFTLPEKIEFKNKRAGIFASFNKKGLINENTVKYIRAAKEHLDYLIFISDNPVIKSEVNKIKDIVDFAIFDRHGEYDFGSYKRGYIELQKLGIFDKINNLLFFNDSVVFEGENLNSVFEQANCKDFFGILASNEGITVDGVYYQNKHIQSWFLLLTNKIFTTSWFDNFIKNISKQKNKGNIIAKYELGLSKIISEHGFALNSFYQTDDNYLENPDLIYANPNKNFEGRLFIKKRHLNS